MLYKLHVSLLEPASIVLSHMFTLLATKDGVQDGQHNDTPIHLGGPCTVEKFDHLLSWFYR